MTQTIMITGASSGIGKATAILFQEHGWNVIATMRDPAAAADLATLDRVQIARLDVTDESSIHTAVESGVERFGSIEVLLNNAGYGAYGPLEATSDDSIVRQFNTNVIGLLRVTKAVVPYFRAAAAGHIVNISSMGGKITFPLGTLYHGTKFAVEGLSEALSFEMAEIGVRVKIIEPGMVRTDFGGRSFDFSNDEKLSAYQPLVQKLFAGFGAAQIGASEAKTVAETIYLAVTDGTDTLRYTAGSDAAQMISARKTQDDETFLKDMRDQFAPKSS